VRWLRDLYQVFGLTISTLLLWKFLTFCSQMTLIMCDANSEHIYNLDHILQCFEAISGLKINLKKFELVAVGEVPNRLI
jgi:hypothetical protein